MPPFLIVLIALWAYPIIAYFVLYFTRNKPRVRKQLLGISLVLSTLTTIGLLLKVSTIFTTVNWLLLTTFYLTASLILWWSQFQHRKWLKYIGAILMIFIFGIGYFSSSLGILGVGLVVANYENSAQTDLGDGLIYKEQSIGNAISDYRGKHIEIYKTVTWLPIFEYRILEKEYDEALTYVNELTVKYEPAQHKIYLSNRTEWEKDKEMKKWSDTIDVK